MRFCFICWCHWCMKTEMEKRVFSKFVAKLADSSYLLSDWNDCETAFIVCEYCLLCDVSIDAFPKMKIHPHTHTHTHTHTYKHTHIHTPSNSLTSHVRTFCTLVNRMPMPMPMDATDTTRLSSWLPQEQSHHPGHNFILSCWILPWTLHLINSSYLLFLWVVVTVMQFVSHRFIFKIYFCFPFFIHLICFNFRCCSHAQELSGVRFIRFWLRER